MNLFVCIFISIIIHDFFLQYIARRVWHFLLLLYYLLEYSNKNRLKIPTFICEQGDPLMALFCFVHPIFSSFGFQYFGHFSCVIFFPVFSILPICFAKCKQRLRNIFVFSQLLSCSRHRTTKFPNSESPIFTTKFLF